MTPVSIPNPWAVAAVAVVCGAVVGAGGAVLQSVSRPWQVGDFRPGVATRAGGPAGAVEVGETTYAFGMVGTGGSGTHDFVIRNVGSGPLTLRRGATSCTCTISDFDAADGEESAAEKVVPPGDSTKVTLLWKGKGPGGPFRQQATILTDDPRRPEVVFVVEGTIVPTWKAVPEAVLLPRVSSATGEQAEVRLFTFGPQPPQVERLFVEHAQADQFFSLASSPLPAADVAAEPGATGGLLLTIVIRPGLPLGPLRTSIEAVLRLPEEVAVSVPVEATVGGDLVLAGAEWDSSRQALLLGTVSSRKGLRTQIFITARGPHRDRVKPVVREVVPDSLDVAIGEPMPIGEGGAVRIPVSVVIPAGSRAANHLCSEQGPAGRIVLDTGHPDSPTLTIPVCVAIGP
ncbi:MAG: DUF1573 domain-containing protein [Pirellulales bacterium]